jgi:hypothetical protein
MSSHTMNATISLSPNLRLRPESDTLPTARVSSAVGVKVPRVVIGLSLAVLVQACVVVLIIGAAWAGVI